MELQQFGSQALDVVKTLRSSVIGQQNIGMSLSKSLFLSTQEALALYSLRDYESSQVFFRVGDPTYLYFESYKFIFINIFVSLFLRSVLIC